MNTSTLAAGVIGFLLGGLVVSVAATLEDGGSSSPHGTSIHSVVDRPTAPTIGP